MVRVVFFGTPDFVLPVLETLWAMRPRVGLAAVVTVPNKPAGRKQTITPPPVKVWADSRGVVVLQPEQLDAALVEKLQKLSPIIGIIAAYGKIIPQGVLAIFPKGVLNIHPSLLPRWRGSSPVQAAITAGDKETGVTIMLTDAEMDHGPILVQERMVLRGDETSGGLTKNLFLLGAELLERPLLLWVEGKIEPRPQDHANATYTKLLSREDGKIDWNRTVESIVRLVRAYAPWPGTFMILPDKTRLKVLHASTVKLKKLVSSGTIAQGEHDEFLVRASDGWVRLDKVQQEGGRPIDGAFFLRGKREIADTFLH